VLNKKAYINHVEKISKNIAEGAQTYSTEELRKSIIKK
jgi:histone H3/H4